MLLSGPMVNAQTTNKSSNSNESSSSLNIESILIRDSRNVLINSDLISNLLEMGFSVQDPMISDDKLLIYDENEKLMVMEDGYYDDNGNWVLVRSYGPDDIIQLKKNNTNINLIINNEGDIYLREMEIIFPTPLQRREFINEASTKGFVSCEDYYVLPQRNSLFLIPVNNRTLIIKTDQPIVLNDSN